MTAPVSAKNIGPMISKSITSGLKNAIPKPSDSMFIKVSAGVGALIGLSIYTKIATLRRLKKIEEAVKDD